MHDGVWPGPWLLVPFLSNTKPLHNSTLALCAAGRSELFTEGDESLSVAGVLWRILIQTLESHASRLRPKGVPVLNLFLFVYRKKQGERVARRESCNTVESVTCFPHCGSFCLALGTSKTAAPHGSLAFASCMSTQTQLLDQCLVIC